MPLQGTNKTTTKGLIEFTVMSSQKFVMYPGGKIYPKGKPQCWIPQQKEVYQETAEKKRAKKAEQKKAEEYKKTGEEEW